MSVTIDALGTWRTFDVTTSWQTYDMYVSGDGESYVDIYPLSNAALSIRYVQLTYGAGVYDWRPAPEDPVTYTWTKVSSEEITLAHVVDIINYQEYYLLQKSTKAAPSKPTTNPPPNAWSETEPALNTEDGDTKTLYVCALTEFSDGTFSWSDVSVSTSYEAAKAALNKATVYQSQVQQLIDSWTATVRATTVRDTGEKVGDLLGRIEITEDVINSTVESLQIAEDGWGKQLSSLQQQTAQDITNVFEEATGYADQRFNGALDYVDKARTWQRFSADGIEQGASNSPFKSKLNNSELGFYQNDHRVSYINESKFFIENGEVVESLSIGGFMWMSSKNGLGLIWKGAENNNG